MFLSSRNIIINKFIKKLEDKMLGPFLIIKKIEALYKLKLSTFMKVYNVFHSNLLRANLGNSLLNQIQESPRSIVTLKGEKYELNDILNSRWHYERLQYRCKWINEKQRNIKWYYANDDKFKSVDKIVKNYYDNNIIFSGNAIALKTRKQRHF